MRDHATDAAFLWLSLGADDIAVQVLTAEPRYAALSAGHRLAVRSFVDSCIDAARALRGSS